MSVEMYIAPLKQQFAGEINTLRGYVSDPIVLSLLLLLGGFILSRLFTIFLEKVVKRITAKTNTDIDDKIMEACKNPVADIIWVLFALLAVHVLNLPGDIYAIFYNTMLSILLVLAALVATRVASTLINAWGKEWAKKTEGTLDDALVPLADDAFKVAVAIVCGILVLGQWGFEIAPLLAGVGVAGLAIGLAVKDSLGNIFGGISLILDKTFGVGDKVELETKEMGIVKEVGLRSTKIITYDNEVITVPNGNLAIARIKNFTRPDKRVRVNIKFGVGYDSDPEKVRRIVLKTITGMDRVLEKPAPSVGMTDMGDFALLMIARFWIDDYSLQEAKKFEANEKIFKALRKNNIEIPFPIRTVYMKKAK